MEWRRKIILPKKTSFGNHEMVSVGRTLQGKRDIAYIDGVYKNKKQTFQEHKPDPGPGGSPTPCALGQTQSQVLLPFRPSSLQMDRLWAMQADVTCPNTSVAADQTSCLESNQTGG